jgi:hypothetical protein
LTIDDRGWVNIQVNLALLGANAPRRSRLLVSCSSVDIHYTVHRTLNPKEQPVYHGDSVQGVTTPEFELVSN